LISSDIGDNCLSPISPDNWYDIGIKNRNRYIKILIKRHVSIEEKKTKVLNAIEFLKRY